MTIAAPRGILIACFIALVLSVGVVISLQRAERHTEPKQTVSTPAEDARVLARLQQILLLPTDAKPLIAVITDVNLFKKNQPEFFAAAKNGNRLVIYPNKAIIYDDSAHRIVKVGPVENVATKSP